MHYVAPTLQPMAVIAKLREMYVRAGECNLQAVFSHEFCKGMEYAWTAAIVEVQALVYAKDRFGEER